MDGWMDRCGGLETSRDDILAAIFTYDIISKIWRNPSMHIYSRKYRNLIWNDGALGFFKRSPQEEEGEETQQKEKDE